MRARTASRGFIGLYMGSALIRKCQFHISQVIVGEIEVQRVLLEQDWGLEDKNLTNSPDVSNIAAIFFSLLIQESVDDSDKSRR